MFLEIVFCFFHGVNARVSERLRIASLAFCRHCPLRYRRFHILNALKPVLVTNIAKHFFSTCRILICCLV